jgi:hypothetical protein
MSGWREKVAERWSFGKLVPAESWFLRNAASEEDRSKDSLREA